MILAVIHSRPERLRELYQNMSTKLVSRFKERDDKIQAIVLNTFAALLRSSFLTNSEEETKDYQEVGLLRTRSSVEELHKHVDFFVGEL